ncbi:MAG TPA: hypothetical protein VN711_01340 [Candidatus Saccharimonadales bacterium]|nr:hypothetical protein [Candidatus Saccharimonadales bacterium]
MDDTNNQQGNTPFMPVAPAAPIAQQNDATQMAGMPPMPPAQETVMPQEATFPSGSLSDFAGMTPPPMPMAPVAPVAPVAPEMPVQAPSYMDTPAQPDSQMLATDAATTTMPMKDSPSRSTTPSQDDYSYAEDILDEILDSLDRIEAKLEALEKKVG